MEKVSTRREDEKPEEKKEEDKPLSTKISESVGKAVAAAAPEKKKKEYRSKEILAQAVEVLNDYGGKETNIPLNSPYWSLMNDYRAELRKEQDNA